MSRIGIIGGSGLYEIEGLVDQKWTRIKTPFGEPSDEILTGIIEGRTVAFLPRHARGHRLLPSELNHRANIWALKSLDVKWILSVSSVGSLQAKYKPCDMVLIDQFIDRTKKSLDHTFFGRGIVAHIAFAEPVCQELRAILLESAKTMKARVHDGGTYLNMEGPAFSTRAESTVHHEAGYSVVGMTNLGEARCSREAEIAYATLAMVTDYDSWKVDEAHVTVELVIENLTRNAAMAKDIVRHAIQLLPRDLACSCHTALESAIMTDPKLWPFKTKRDLELLLARRESKSAPADQSNAPSGSS
jgi:5'-methylthioadenosine phosphorylase